MHPWQELDDAELDGWVRTRLKSVGVDITVLPDDDPDAPADQTRILGGARRSARSSRMSGGWPP